MKDLIFAISITVVILAFIGAITDYNIRIEEAAINNGLVQCVKNTCGTYWTTPEKCYK